MAARVPARGFTNKQASANTTHGPRGVSELYHLGILADAHRPRVYTHRSEYIPCRVIPGGGKPERLGQFAPYVHTVCKCVQMFAKESDAILLLAVAITIVFPELAVRHRTNGQAGLPRGRQILGPLAAAFPHGGEGVKRFASCMSRVLTVRREPREPACAMLPIP